MKYFLSFMISRVKIGRGWALFNWLNTKNVLIEDENHPMYQACEAKSKKINPFMVNGVYDDFNYLRDNFFLVKNQEIVRNMVREQYRLAISPENLSVTFMPVDQACNFRCVYCYEDHSKNKFMDNDDFDIFCKFISKQKISTLRVDYFGGEPLLNISFIKKCNSRLIEIGKEQ